MTFDELKKLPVKEAVDWLVNHETDFSYIDTEATLERVIRRLPNERRDNVLKPICFLDCERGDAEWFSQFEVGQKHVVKLCDYPLIATITKIGDKVLVFENFRNPPDGIWDNWSDHYGVWFNQGAFNDYHCDWVGRDEEVIGGRLNPKRDEVMSRAKISTTQPDPNLI